MVAPFAVVAQAGMVYTPSSWAALEGLDQAQQLYVPPAFPHVPHSSEQFSHWSSNASCGTGEGNGPRILLQASDLSRVRV